MWVGGEKGVDGFMNVLRSIIGGYGKKGMDSGMERCLSVGGVEIMCG